MGAGGMGGERNFQGIRMINRLSYSHFIKWSIGYKVSAHDGNPLRRGICRHSAPMLNKQCSIVMKRLR